LHPKKINILFKITFLIFFATLFYSCKNNSGNVENLSQKSDSAFTIKDDAGIELKFESHPKRIISLAPNITEAIFAIGADSMLVGVTDLCDYPPEAKLKVKTGSYITPDYEKILSLKPDLIIMYAENISQPIYQALKNYNLKLFVSNAKNIDGVIKMIKDLGIITGKDSKADAIADSISTLRNEYKTQNTGITPEKALVVISVNPLMTANKNTFINEIVELSGFENIYKNESIDYPLISYEDVVNKNPEFIILPGDTLNTDNLKKI
jgi:iron complex transport system substrate-binding protein